MDRRTEYSIILFDGVCNFCNRSVQFIIKHDRKGHFRFASLQSDVGRAFLTERPGFQNLDSIVLVEKGKMFIESTAVLRIAGKLDGLWRLGFILLAIPRALRDPFYRFLARHRYRWFGKEQSCMIPSPEIKERFLSND